ncbi:MAG: hypothetical protein ABFD79_08960 [Phycisphaerales bacterium]
MADTFKKVRNGDKLRIPAGTYNAMIDAAQDYIYRKTNINANIPQTLPANMVYIKNTTLFAVDRFGVLGISGSEIDAADNNFKNTYCFTGLAPSLAIHSGGRFVIAAEPIAANAIGRAYAAGIVTVQIDITDETHTCADIEAEDKAKLKSAASGAAAILWKETGTGTKWAVIRFGGGGGGSTQLRGKIVVAPTFQDPYASSDSPAYAGFGYYIVRLIDEPQWESGTEYSVNAKVTDPSDNRVYIMTNTDPDGMESPDLAPHENAIDWTISEEIKIEYSSCLYNRQTETGIAIKDCVPVYPIGNAVKITEFKKIDGSTIYLLDETVSYVGTPEERTLTMFEGKLMAVYQ